MCWCAVKKLLTHSPHISATGRPIHFMFGSRVGFSGTADLIALFSVWTNPRWRRPPSWIISNGHIFATAHTIYLYSAHRTIIFAIAQLSCFAFITLYHLYICKVIQPVSRIMHTELHWLDVPERINYKLVMLMYRCQHNKAPRYLMDHCTSVSDVAYRQRLHSASSLEVSVPRHRLSTYGRRAFAVAGPTVWNSAQGHAWSGCFWGHLQAVTEDVFIFAVLVCSVH